MLCGCCRSCYTLAREDSCFQVGRTGRREGRSGRLPQCKGAPWRVQVTCPWVYTGLHLDESAFALLQPELGSALDEAAERALNSLDVALPDFETDYSVLEGFF